MMRIKIIWIAVLLSASAFGQTTPKDSITGKEKSIDSLVKKRLHVASNGDTTVIVIDKLLEAFKKEESSKWDKYLPAFIALLTVGISSVTSYIAAKIGANTQMKIASKQIDIQIAVAKEQANTQMLLAKEQLAVSREQISQTEKNTLEQARATILSKARIEWLNELRKLLAKYINLSGMISEQMQHIKSAQKGIETESLQLIIENNLNDHRALQAEIFMYLNIAEKEHKDLQDSMIGLMDAIEKPKENNIHEKMGEMLVMAQVLLKATWEQAKQEVKSMKA